MVTSSLVERMYSEYRFPLFQRILSVVRDREEAEDLVQEVFIRFSRSTATFSCDRAIHHYLHRMARNIAIDRIRHYKLVPMCDLADVDNHLESRDDPVVRQERQEQIRNILNSLAPHEVRWFALIVRGYTIPEIAKMTETTTCAIKARLHRVRQQLSGGVS